MLDLGRVSQQITQMAVEGQLLAEDLRKRLDLALRQLHLESTRLAAFTDKLALSKTSWLLAGIHESLEQHLCAADTPPGPHRGRC